MTVEEAIEWVQSSGDTIKMNLCVGQDECDEVDKETEEIIALLKLVP